MRAISLMYHDVVEPGADDASGFQRRDAAPYKLARGNFEQHLAAIAGAVKTRPLTAPELPGEGEGAPWLITFDDGGLSAYTHIADLLESYGWRGHFFVATDYLGSESFLSRAQVRELHQRGHVMGSHSCSHPMRMAGCSWEELLREWRVSAAVLADITGEPTLIASVPGGNYSRAVGAAAAAAGIRVLFTSEPTASAHRVDGCLVLGRYSVRRSTAPGVAASLAAGRAAPRLKQAVVWNAKKIGKAFGGSYFWKARRVMFAD